MALELSQEQRKLSIPAQNDARGTDLHIGGAFDNARDPDAILNNRFEDNEVHEKQTIENLSKSGASAAIIKTGAGENMAASDAVVKENEQEQKKRTDTQMLLASLRNDLQNELNDIEVRRGDIGEMRDGIEDVFANGYDLGEDGKITNEQAEKALAEYEKRTGKTVDRDDETAVYAALDDQWKEFDREEIEMNARANEIKHYMENDLRVAEQKAADPNTSPEEAKQIIEIESNKVDKLTNKQADNIETAITHDETGYKGQQSAEIQEMKSDASSYVNTFG